MTGQENSDLLIQVTAFAGFTVSIYMREKKKFIVLTTYTYKFGLIIKYECIHSNCTKLQKITLRTCIWTFPDHTVSPSDFNIIHRS